MTNIAQIPVSEDEALLRAAVAAVQSAGSHLAGQQTADRSIFRHPRLAQVQDPPHPGRSIRSDHRQQHEFRRHHSPRGSMNCVHAPLKHKDVKVPDLAVSDLKKHVGFWLRFVSNHVSHAFARKLLASGVTVAEWVVVREMFDDEETSPGVLAERIGMTRGGVSKLVDRLVSKKLVTRQDRSDDRRFQSIALTAVGRRQIPQLAALADQNDEEFFRPLSVRERTMLIAAMKKLVEAHGLRTLPTE